jgi:hypothetical protein
MIENSHTNVKIYVKAPNASLKNKHMRDASGNLIIHVEKHFTVFEPLLPSVTTE